jgi:membrane protein involved in colicin uptake
VRLEKEKAALALKQAEDKRKAELAKTTAATADDIPGGKAVVSPKKAVAAKPVAAAPKPAAAAAKPVAAAKPKAVPVPAAEASLVRTSASRYHPQVTLVCDNVNVLAGDGKHGKTTPTEASQSPISVTVEQDNGKVRICISKTYRKQQLTK